MQSIEVCLDRHEVKDLDQDRHSGSRSLPYSTPQYRAYSNPTLSSRILSDSTSHSTLTHLVSYSKIEIL